MKTKTNLILLSILLSVFVVADPEPKPITEHPNFSNMEKALRNFVRQHGVGEKATLIIPNYRDKKESVVIYWVEERALFDFAPGIPSEAVKQPGLLSRRFWNLTDDFFYPADSTESGNHSSTFMGTWEWAKEKVFAAVKDGHILYVESPSPELLVSITNIRSLREQNESLRILYTVHHPEALSGTTFLVEVHSRARDEFRESNPPGSLHTLTVTSVFAETLRRQNMARENIQRQIDSGVDPTKISTLILASNLEDKDILVDFKTYQFK